MARPPDGFFTPRQNSALVPICTISGFCGQGATNARALDGRCDELQFEADVQPRRREAPSFPNRRGRRSGSSEWINFLRLPVAGALIGKAPGDVVLVGDHEIEILSIEEAGMPGRKAVTELT